MNQPQYNSCQGSENEDDSSGWQWKCKRASSVEAWFVLCCVAATGSENGHCSSSLCVAATGSENEHGSRVGRERTVGREERREIGLCGRWREARWGGRREQRWAPWYGEERWVSGCRKEERLGICDERRDLTDRVDRGEKGEFEWFQGWCFFYARGLDFRGSFCFGSVNGLEDVATLVLLIRTQVFALHTHQSHQPLNKLIDNDVASDPVRHVFLTDRASTARSRKSRKGEHPHPILAGVLRIPTMALLANHQNQQKRGVLNHDRRGNQRPQPAFSFPSKM
eukprot:1356873-Amorphochlora_amoeboformis.AAC.1